MTEWIREKVKKVLDVFDPAAGFQRHGFMPENQGDIPVPSIGKNFAVTLCAMMRVDDDALDAGADQVVEGMGDHGPALNGQQRLGPGVGQRAEPCSKSCSEHKSCRDIFQI